MINTKSEEQGLAHQEGKDRRFLRPDQLKRLYKRHLQAAYLRSGASLFMWLFILGPYLYGVIDIDSFRGASASVAFIVLLNIPTLWALKHINRWWTYEFCSLFINLLEVIGYTAVLYFLGGLRAAYMIPIYTVIIFYIGGTLAPRRFPFILASFCAVCFCAASILEHIGILPHQNFVIDYQFTRERLISVLAFLTALLYVAAFISAYTSGIIKRARNRMRKQNIELERSRSELSKAAESLKEKNIQLRESERLKSAFLANMSHEIRTPMNAVIGFADMLLDTDLDREQIDYVKTLKKGGDTLLSLINDILDLSKIEAGELDFEENEFDPELLAYDVCELIRPRIGSKPIEILYRVGDNIPSNAKGDPLRLRQVLTNLMSNAAKFTESGEIEFAIDIEEEREDRIKFHVTVRDTGVGIPNEKMNTVFEPFQQADISTTRRFGGTGLGLTICKQISRLMDGDIWVESEVGKGAIFHLTGWLGKTEDKESKRFSAVSLSGKKVLIVDDNQTNLDILVHVLESVDMDVVSLRDPRRVISVIQDALETGAPFDICISDIQMPGISGFETARLIRDPKNRIPDIPLIALSSSIKRDAKKCEESGFDGFMTKPLHREKLFQMLERMLGEMKDVTEKDETPRPKIMTKYSVREDMKHSVRILLVEDNPVNQKLARMMLNKAGYQVGVANNGQEAVEKYTASPEYFDLIFMDVQMPEMDGIEATKAIRSHEEQLRVAHYVSRVSDESNDNIIHETRNPRPETRHIPIVAMTAHAMKGDRAKCLAAGMDEYIRKPVKRELVLEIIDKMVLSRKVG